MNVNLKDLDLDAMLVAALAKQPRKARGGTGDTAIKAAARESATQLKMETAHAALAARDAELEAEYAARFGRLAELGKLGTAVRKRIAEHERITGYTLPSGVVVKPARGYSKARRADEAALAITAMADLANVKLEQGVLFAQPIHPSDLNPETGRFVRSARYYVNPANGQRGRNLTASGFGIREDDMVAAAVVLCYEDGEKSLAEAPLGWTVGKTVTLPTVGAMYRNLKKAHHLALDRYRQYKRGLVQMAIADIELGGAAQQMIYVDSSEYELGALMAVGELVTPDREALAQAALREAKAAHRLAQARLDAAQAAEGDEVARVMLLMLAAGQTVAEVATKRGISQARVIAEVKALDARASHFYRNPDAHGEQAMSPRWDAVRGVQVA